MGIKPIFKSLLSITFILCIFSTLSCEKNDDVSEPADKFVGVYSYTMTLSGGITSTGSGNLVIKKLTSKRIEFAQDGVYFTYYEVIGDTIIEESGQTTELYISNTEKATFDENSIGILDENILTVNGAWERNGYETTNFNIVCKKNL